jgi:hypothetical protein
MRPIVISEEDLQNTDWPDIARYWGPIEHAQPQQRRRNENARWAPPRHATPEAQQQAIGNRLFALISPAHPELAGKITGMFLEGMGTPQLVAMINDRAQLNAKVKVALTALARRAPSCLPRHVEEILMKEAERNGDCCIISFEKIQVQTAAVTSCGHVFDRESIAQWLKTNAQKACPSCRQMCTIRA